MANTWEQVEQFFLLRAGNEAVAYAKLVDDSCGFGSCGTAYYDTIALGDADMTLEKRSDTTMGCSKEFESAFTCS